MLALITGASDGIGKAYAYELAKKNYNLILIARREEKLKDLQTSLQSVYNISALYYSIDLSENQIHGNDIHLNAHQLRRLRKARDFR